MSGGCRRSQARRDLGTPDPDTAYLAIDIGLTVAILLIVFFIATAIGFVSHETKHGPMRGV